MNFIVIALIIVFLIILVRLIKIPSKKSGPVIIVRYYRPSCGACRKSQSEWDSFKALAKASKAKCKIVDVNTEEKSDINDAWLAKHDIKTVPCVVKFVNNDKEVYDGPRTSTAYMKFATS